MLKILLPLKGRLFYCRRTENVLALRKQIHMVNNERLVVLLVDDSVLIMDKMIGILREIEDIRTVIQASCYSEAVPIIEEVEPDVVIMDIFLGDSIGFDLLNFLKARYPSIGIIVITNHSGQRYRDLCKKMGAHHFLDKSNDFELIPELIRGGNNIADAKSNEKKC